MKQPIANPARGALVVFPGGRSGNRTAREPDDDEPGSLAWLDKHAGTWPTHWLDRVLGPKVVADQLCQAPPSLVNQSGAASSSSATGNPPDERAAVLALFFHHACDGEHG